MNVINSFFGFASACIFGQFLGDTGESRSIASALCLFISLPLPILNLSYGIRLDLVSSLQANLLKFILPSLTLLIISIISPIEELKIKWILIYILVVNVILGYRTCRQIEKMKASKKEIQ